MGNQVLFFLLIMAGWLFVGADCLQLYAAPVPQEPGDDGGHLAGATPDGVVPEMVAKSREALEQFTKYLDQYPDSFERLSDQQFATTPLTRQDSDSARRALAFNSQKLIRQNFAKAMRENELQLGKLKMPFSFKKFGKKPEQGWSLFISLHGGGATAASVNDQQWENQKRLYQLDEGIYVAPRAPTNSWNLWHQSHIDLFLGRLIKMFVAFEDVNWNRVYILGYSAGGDGVYQLAPRMADRWAAAAMMAGHPNETSPLGLRNVPFALQVGGLDSGYNRNRVAVEWEKKLAALRAEDPGGYRHLVKIYPDKGHWMDLEDAIAIPWMANINRVSSPKRVVWKQDDVTCEQSYWLRVNEANRKPRSKIEATIRGQTVSIVGDGIQAVTVLLDDRLVDLDQSVRIESEGSLLFEGVLNRTISTLAQCMNRKGDPNLCYDASVEVKLPLPFPENLISLDDIPRYEAMQSGAPLVIDGKLDEPAWDRATKTTKFVDLVSGEQTLHSTKAAILWDQEYLYIGFWLGEPNVKAKYRERDDPLYYDNDAEVFIAGKNSYYEFEINALGTVYEGFFVWEDSYDRDGFADDPQLKREAVKAQPFNGVGYKRHPRGERIAFLGYDFPNFKSAVDVIGTLNDDTDQDRQWTVELAFPWKEMGWLAKGDSRPLPPRDGDVWRINLFRFNTYKKPGLPKDSGGWAWGKHGVWDSHLPELFPMVTFRDQETVKTREK